MRNDIIAYLKTQSLGTVGISAELPWSKDNEGLYLKNFKKIYVDQDQTIQEPLFNTMDGGSIVSQTTTVVAYLTVDAKTPLVNYDAIVSLMVNARNMVAIDSKLDRTVSVAKNYEGDAIVTEFTFEFREIKTQ